MSIGNIVVKFDKKSTYDKLILFHVMVFQMDLIFI